MSKFSNQAIEDQGQIELAEECGLTLTGREDGRPQFIGDNRAWDYFNNGGKY